MQLHGIADTLRLGEPLSHADGAVILLHGRGSSADDIARLVDVFSEHRLTFLAPSARQGSWYPQRFLTPLAQNEPWLSSALSVVDHLALEVQAAGIPLNRMAVVGFSQGGCLALEYAARHPRRYGFIGGLSAALIGPLATPRALVNLDGTPVLLGCAEQDPHIPLPHVEESAMVLSRFGAVVTKHIFPGTAHTVFSEEITWLEEQAETLWRKAK